jgi:hypothetical protein
MNATAMQMSNSSAKRKMHHPMSLHVALLAQQQIRKDEALQTDVMIYRQPASDVPVPAGWRPSRPAPLDPLDNGKPGDEVDESYDEDMVGWESAGVSIHRLEQFERHSEPRRIAAKGARLSILLLGSVVTFTLVGWVTLI